MITGANPVPYEFDTAETITADELKKAMADRQTYLAEVKQRYVDYKNSVGAEASAFTVTTTSGSFNF